MKHDDEICNPSVAPHFSDILNEWGHKRRILLKAGAGSAALFLMSAAKSVSSAARPSTAPAIGFTSVDFAPAGAGRDLVRVPPGYSVQVLYAWGDPIGKTGIIAGQPAFAGTATESAAEQELQAGGHHDGMHFFALSPKNPGHGLLVINHEYIDQALLFPDGMDNWNLEKVRKAQAAHGVSIIEVRRQPGGNWSVVRPSRYARRITGNTPMNLSGPAAGHPLMRTAADPGGTLALGTLNNCAHGYTPWGTYLTCEENFNGYFANPTGDVEGVADEDQKIIITRGQSRYGISRSGSRYRWHEFDARFRADLNPNEPHRFGWVVEIDPFDPQSRPVKRTALGRIKHEGAWYTLAKDGRVVVYMGDDQQNEYIYKFVTRDRYDGRSRKANVNLLDEGTLYVARFDATPGSEGRGRGEWLELSPRNPALSGFGNLAEILIRTREAATATGATPMDRPEWIAVHPQHREVYCALTNNSGRGKSAKVDAANPRANNSYGHIIRWRESDGDAAAAAFEWDIFVLAGDPAQDGERRGNIAGDAYGSPDGLWFDPDGRLWIQTDISSGALGSGAYANMPSNMMLCADPATGRTRRFLTGPRGCEVTGVITTPDSRSMFVNIQHPGEGKSDAGDAANPTAISHWPYSQGYGPAGRPRSATIVITRKDGGVIGT